MLSWPSPAKLNLFLYIVGRRSDGYHNLQTLFHFLDYNDSLSYSIRADDQINLITPIAGVANEKNLIVIAAKALQEYAKEQSIQLLGVDISLDKKLPMGGGLGGASSNAATTLVALNQLWNLNLSQEVLIDIGRKLGADVPIFIYGHTAFAEGVGDQLQPLDVPEQWYLVARPNVEISTVKIFSDQNLKRDTVTKNLTELLKAPFKNDCEETACHNYPEVQDVITLLSQYSPARLTGTGSCVFAVFDSEQAALDVKAKLPADLDCFIAKGVNVSPLFNARHKN